MKKYAVEKMFGVTPLKAKSYADRKTFKPKYNNSLVMVLSPEGGLHIWDSIPTNYEFRGWAQIYEATQWRAYEVWAHTSFYNVAQIDQKLADHWMKVANWDVK